MAVSPSPRAPGSHTEAGRVIELGGQAVYVFQFQTPLERSFEYFCDIPTVLRLLPDMLDVSAYGPDRYRLIVGATDGHGHSMSAIFDLAARRHRNQAIWIEPSNDGPPVHLPGIVFHGTLSAEAIFKPSERGTAVRYTVDIDMSIPIPSVLRFMPQNFLQSLGEHAMSYKMTQMINGFAHGIHRDFNEWASHLVQA